MFKDKYLDISKLTANPHIFNLFKVVEKHGGVLRFSRHIGTISPQLMPFPRYCCGDFYQDGQCMIVSAGLGEHTMPLRIHNPRELIFIEMKS